MIASLKTRLYVLKSRTVRWLGAYLPAAGIGLEAVRDQLPSLQEYIPTGLYKGLVIAGVAGVVLRVMTNQPLAAYREPTNSEGDK